MTRSERRSDSTLEFDVPTTPEDNEALWQAHLDSMKISTEELFAKIRRDYEPKRTELNRDGDEEFTLVDD